MKAHTKSIAVLSLATAMVASHEAAACDADGADWTQTAPTMAGGLIGGVDFFVEGHMSTPIIEKHDLTGPDYAAARLSAGEEMIVYSYGSSWTAVFELHVHDLLLYGKFWRGTTGTGVGVVYTFDRPFTILSGFPNAIVSGNTLSIPSGSFEDGILLFEGPHLSLGVDVDAPGGFSRQLMTFGRLHDVECTADIDGDCLVGFGDLVTILTAWGTCSGCAADIDGDGDVGFGDLTQVLGSWGLCAP